MLRSLKSLKQSRIQTSNGTIGSIADYLFDDARWSIRYLIVNTGGWLSRKEVLISPLVIEQVEASLQDIRLSVTKEKVENSPDVDSHLPVSRQKEKQHHDYYQWPYYWAGTGIGGMATYPTVMLDRARLLQTPPREFPKDLSDDNGDPHLRSAKVVEGYEISATDNLFGSVDDFIIDDESWTIRYLVINTAKFWFEKSVLISPEWVSSISWSDGRISVDLTKEQIKNSPEFDPNSPVNHEYEVRLYDYYGRPNYWVKDASAHAEREPQVLARHVI
jgi:uncharacterized protein YrrD